MSGRAETAIATDFAYIPRAAGIAREAGARLREYFTQGVETEYKGDVDLVTVADRTVEKLIRTRLGEAFPEHGIYGEEGTRERMEGEFRWYVDPLDGTTNFAHGFPQFCVSMGLEHRPAGLKPEDDGMLRLTREGKPNLFIYKHQISSITEVGKLALRRAKAATPEANGSAENGEAS